MKLGSSNISIGAAQLGKPAPVGYRNFSNAMIIFIIPATIGVVSGWGLPDKIANHWLLVLGLFPALIKAIGTLLGNGQYYTSDKTAADDQAVANDPQNK